MAHFCVFLCDHLRLKRFFSVNQNIPFMDVYQDVFLWTIVFLYSHHCILYFVFYNIYAIIYLRIRFATTKHLDQWWTGSAVPGPWPTVYNYSKIGRGRSERAATANSLSCQPTADSLAVRGGGAETGSACPPQCWKALSLSSPPGDYLNNESFLGTLSILDLNIKLKFSCLILLDRVAP